MWPFSKSKTYELTPIQELFFALLRAQLWLRPVDNIALPSTMQEWDELMDLGYRQTVICFISAACLRHKDVGKIPTEIREEMEAVLEENKKIHEHHNKTIVDVFTLLEDNGLHPILLKGQGLAQLYDSVEPDSSFITHHSSLADDGDEHILHSSLLTLNSQNSVLRQCGDIDIFIGPADYEKACRIMDDYCGPEAKQNEFYEDQLHYHISNGGVTFEIHRKAADAAKTYRDKPFNSWAYEWLVPEKCESIIINDKKILVPRSQYNTLYVFDHLIKHIRCEGVNLRQFCDWMMVIYGNHAIVNSDILLFDLKKYSSLKAWQVLGGILVCLLGYVEETFLYWDKKKSLKSQTFIFDEIINGSTFCLGTKLKDNRENIDSGIKRTILSIIYCYKLSRPVCVISLRSAIIHFSILVYNRILFNVKN